MNHLSHDDLSFSDLFLDLVSGCVLDHILGLFQDFSLNLLSHEVDFIFIFHSADELVKVHFRNEFFLF